MSFIGWNDRLSQVDKGTFNCPNCRRDARYRLMEARKWFNLFFIPVFPESRPLRSVQCDRCKVAFDERVLETVVSAGVQDTGEKEEPGDWPPGSRVLAVWPIEQIFWYPATVARSTKRWVEIHYDDGHKARVKASEVMKINFQVGTRVFARLRGGPAYHPGEITHIDGEKIRIAYDDGGKESTTIAVVRVMHGPGADIDWEYGDRVLAPFDPPFFYPATVTSVEGDLVKVEFDDGDGVELPRVLLRRLDLKESDPIYCRWKSGPAYFYCIASFTARNSLGWQAVV